MGQIIQGLARQGQALEETPLIYAVEAPTAAVTA